jgi:predicted nucleic acid-binding protein
MTAVFCDNSSLSALAEIGLLGILPKIVGPVRIPAAVAAEGLHPGAPEALRQLINEPPDWLVIVPDPESFLEETDALGAGEASAITLAWLAREGSRLVLDERRGRAVARALGLRVTGLLAILVEAALAGEIEFEDSLSRLQATGFRLSQALMDDARAAVERGSET